MYQNNINLELAKANTKNIVQGDTYRMTVLSESLIRFEYSPVGIFEDLPTEFAWFRNTDDVNFKLTDSGSKIIIETRYVKVTYCKNKPFIGPKINPQNNLKVEILNSNRIWYYTHPEARKLGGPDITMQDKSGKIRFSKGFYSLDGFTSVDDSNNLVIDSNGNLVSRANKEIDVYLFVYGNDYDVALKDYYNLTGYPTLIPRYVLGNWWQKNELYKQSDLTKLIENFSVNDIPLSVLMLDKNWHIRPKVNNKYLNTGFSFNGGLLPNPSELIKYLKNKEIRLGLSISLDDGFHNCDAIYNEAKKYLDEVNGFIPVNILNPKFMEVYMKFYIHPLINSGVDLFFLDNKVNNLQLQYYHYMDMKSRKKRSIIMGYNSKLVPHRYPIVYSGKTIVNFQTLKQIPIYNSCASNGAFSWCTHDVGGYYKGIEENELYIRFVQLGVFSPILKFGSDGGKYYRREPWNWDVGTKEIVKYYLQLRHKLIPYLYNEAYNLSRYGKLLIRPLYYDYKDFYDDILFRNEYYFGSQLFVAPIVNRKDKIMNRVIHKFFIPEGIWYDFMNGKKYSGNKKYVSFYKDQDYAVFAKKGAIIPLNQDFNIDLPKNLEIQIFPGANNSYNLYEDDGATTNYQTGSYNITNIEYKYEKDNYQVILKPVKTDLSFMPSSRNYKIKFRNTTRIKDISVIVNNRAITYNSYEKNNNFIVEISDAAINANVIINVKGTNIDIEAVKLIEEDFASILGDLKIETSLKVTVDGILFGNLPINKKRIEIRKLVNKGLDRKFVELFLKLLEYLEQV